MASQRSSPSLFSNWKLDLIAAAGEFIGTTLFLLFSLGAVQTVNTNVGANSDGTSGGTDVNANDVTRLLGFYYICSAFGFALFAIASIFYRFTGSIFNPSVSLALVLIGVITPIRFLLISFAQMLGGIVAAAILAGLTPGELNVGVALNAGTNRAQGLFIEMFTTGTLVLSVLMLAAEKHQFTPFAPLGFGMVLFVVMLMSIQYTGGAVNTARAFGPAVVQGDFDSYHWIYWLGPTLGGLMATGIYVFLKKNHYWRINPGQDSTDVRDSAMARATHTPSISHPVHNPPTGNGMSEFKLQNSHVSNV
ncbi:aquaporin-like protein [Cylindrobasidium torrendii FP15055 ss-10]|uniref:Aquaporin-like protein n=1 Tax=Cylindrobasidium torrendii FP15055 ss-10 TaxID=1314674 RepID=A0A0D7BCF6_9AGAR|nr:aquaporin-like protein [Cylindrobasidium torrendii FP15055 ss-10]